MQKYLYQKMYEVETTHWWFQAKKDILIQLIKNKIIPQLSKSEINIADIGCGAGLLLDSLSKFGHVTGIDYSNNAIEFCKNSFSGELIQADCGTTDLNINKKFDLIIATDLIEHIKDDRIAINNIYNLLNDNGYAIITVPAFQFLWSQHDVINMHYRRYSFKTLYEAIKTTPFNICYLSYYNFFLFLPALIVRITKKILNIDKKSDLEFSTPPNLVNKLFYKLFYSESKFITKRKKFPFGVSLIAIIKK